MSVAILDSGLDFTHVDFKGKKNITFYNAALDSHDRADCDDATGHGSDCAAILCAQGINMCGVAPDVTLHVIKTSNPQGETRTASILKGLEEAIRKQPDVVSLSFSIPKEDENFAAIQKKVKEAFDANIIVVAAAGNSGEIGFPVDEFPASFSECLSIGSIDRNKQRGATSNQSEFLDLMGPGEEVLSLTHSDKLISGTSYATPFVAGAIALLISAAKSKGKNVSNLDVFDVLKRTADKNVPNYNSLEYGWGLINPTQALELLLKI